MAISADWQGELQATSGAWLFGDTSGATGTRIIPGSPVKQTTVRSSRAMRGADHGEAVGPERYGKTTIRTALEWYSTTAALVEADVQVARKACKLDAADDGELIRLDLREPGTPETNMAYFGRPRPLSIDPTLHRFFRKTGTFTFEAFDPFAYGAAAGPTNYLLAGSPHSITNDGDADTRRVTIDINGNGGTPVITNTSDSNGDLTFSEVLAGGSTWTVDLYNETVVDGSSVNKIDALSPAAIWFKFRPGANSVTIAGCASIDVTIRPAWAPGG